MFDCRIYKGSNKRCVANYLSVIAPRGRSLPDTEMHGSRSSS